MARRHVLGVRSLTGVLPVPQLALWEHFDPTGSRRRAYNRYLHPVFFAWDRPGRLRGTRTPHFVAVRLTSAEPNGTIV